MTTCTWVEKKTLIVKASVLVWLNGDAFVVVDQSFLSEQSFLPLCFPHRFHTYQPPQAFLSAVSFGNAVLDPIYTGTFAFTHRMRFQKSLPFTRIRFI